MPTIVCPCGTERHVKPAEASRGARYCSRPCMYRYRKSVRHGLARRTAEDPLYRFWTQMVNRCTNPGSQGYSGYGGRGIWVADEWLDRPTEFVDWVRQNLGERPTPSHSLDRIDNDGGYMPGNLRWATRSEQAINQRKRRSNSGVRGVYRTKYGTYQAMIWRNRKAINLGTHKTLEAAAVAVAEGVKQYTQV